MSSQNKTIAVLMTCHNRKDLTLKSIASVSAAIAAKANYKVFLVDDGSTDGTSEAVSDSFPDTTIVKGDGNLYWNRGMRLAWQTAMDTRPDFFLWLNDDLELRPNAVADMLSLWESTGPRTIVAGRTIDPASRETTYGGYRILPGFSKLRFRHLTAGEQACDTMNGNCVLIPFQAAMDVGINSEKYSHAFGDNDYGLRASRRGYAIVQLEPPVGEQERNAAYAKKVSRLTLKNWRFIMLNPKGVPISEWLHFCKSHGGPQWPVNFLFRYVKMALSTAGN